MYQIQNHHQDALFYRNIPSPNNIQPHRSFKDNINTLKEYKSPYITFPVIVGHTRHR